MQLGRYEVLRKLGEGGMARVLLAKNTAGDHVVLKVPFTLSTDFAERVRDEARVGLRIHHPSVVDTLDLFEHEGRPILVVEYVEGASLQQLRRHGGPMPPGLVARIGRQVAEGLAFIHDATDENEQPLNILHRDVAPGNILVTQDGNAKLIDLGIARGVETKAKKTQVGTVRGTMRYLAPELLAGEAHTQATDLWALGVVLFEAALGRRAAEGDDREVLATILRGDLAKLREGEVLDAVLRDGLYALLAPREARLQKAKAAANVFRRIEESLGASAGWAKGAVGGVLAQMRERWASEDPADGLADAVTLVRSSTGEGPEAAPSSEEGGEPEQTALTVASEEGSGSDEDAGAAEPKTGITDPRRKVNPEEELGHADGAAPTVRMSAVDLPDGILSKGRAPSSEGATPTEVMPTVDDAGGSEAAGPTQQSPFRRSAFESTQKFAKPGSVPQLPERGSSSPQEGSASLAWRSVAAPTLLGLTATEDASVDARLPDAADAGADARPPAAPAKPAGPIASAEEPSAAAPQEHTEVEAPAPTQSGASDDLARPRAGAPPAETLSSLPEAVAVPREPATPAKRRTDPAHRAPNPAALFDPDPDPAHRAPDPRALGRPTPLPADAAAAVTPPPGGGAAPEETTETAFPYGVPDSLAERPAALKGAAHPSSGPADARPGAASQPPPPRVPAPEPTFAGGLLADTDATMRVPPAPRAGFIGQRANPDDMTERVSRKSQDAAAAEAALGFEEPLLSGELAWKPKRTHQIAVAAGIVVAVLVALGLLVALDVL